MKKKLPKERIHLLAIEASRSVLAICLEVAVSAELVEFGTMIGRRSRS